MLPVNDYKSHCWALGCLWYELLTGNKLFEEMACNDWRASSCS